MDGLVDGSVLEVVEGEGAWHGVVIRHPLMDVDIMDFGFSVESRALVAGRCHKWLLRRAMADRLPADVTGRIETTVFTCLFTREEAVLRRLPPGSEWHLARLGIVLADAIDRRLTEPYSLNDTYDIQLYMTNNAKLVSVITPTNVTISNDAGIFMHVSPTNDE